MYKIHYLIFLTNFLILGKSSLSIVISRYFSPFLRMNLFRSFQGPSGYNVAKFSITDHSSTPAISPAKNSTKWASIDTSILASI